MRALQSDDGVSEVKIDSELSIDVEDDGGVLLTEKDSVAHLLTARQQVCLVCKRLNCRGFLILAYSYPSYYPFSYCYYRLAFYFTSPSSLISLSLTIHVTLKAIARRLFSTELLCSLHCLQHVPNFAHHVFPILRLLFAVFNLFRLCSWERVCCAPWLLHFQCARNFLGSIGVFIFRQFHKPG